MKRVIPLICLILIIALLGITFSKNNIFPSKTYPITGMSTSSSTLIISGETVTTPKLHINTYTDTKVLNSNLVVETTAQTDTQSSNSDIVVETTTEISFLKLEPYAEDFPTISKAILYNQGTPTELEPTDIRIIKMVNYIMYSVEQESYGFVTGVLANSDIEDFYKPQKGTYMILNLEPQNSQEFNRFDKAIISGKTVVLIDSDSTSYHGEGNPFNRCITPYYDKYSEYESIPNILELFF